MTTKSPEVVEFLVLFNDVKTRCGNDPSKIDLLWENDLNFCERCRKLHWAGRRLRRAERRYRELFAKNVGDDFIVAWRDFEGRYEKLVDPLPRIAIEIDLESLGLKASTDEPPTSEEEVEWEDADSKAMCLAEAFTRALDAADTSVGGWPSGDSTRTWEEWEILEGLEAWGSLCISELELRGVLRRRALTGFVLLPPGAEAYFPNEDFPRLVFEAQNCFIFGNHMAFLAVMRSIVESILVFHFGCDQDGLKPKISCAIRNGLPENLGAALHIFNNTVRCVLHGNEGASRFLELSEKEREISLRRDYLLIRTMIEGVKETDAAK